jgi:(1->4)-alpha-D-glucan 1-alpha-D-glucosylmutase
VKITAPGVPDFYQGTELWDLALVDPDNRRPVDYAARRAVLEAIDTAEPSALLASRTDGRVKALLMVRALRQRAALRDTFESGSYLPLSAWGERRDHLFAFARQHGEATAITCVPRLVAGLLADRATPPLGREVWGDTRIRVPDQGSPWPTKFRDAVTGAILETRTDADGIWLDAAMLFERFPAALLVPVR